jgi:dTDP-glucose pyrophosphorylase
MTVIVTMAGLGTRFSSNGYAVPKHMIKARGRPLFDWSMASLRQFFEQKFIFACLQEHDTDWIMQRAVQLGIQEVEICARASVSRGQAETAYDVTAAAKKSSPLWVFNIDTYIKDGLSPADLGPHDGCIHVFETDKPGMSYVSFEDGSYISDIAEKEMISNWATVGMYGFKSVDFFRSLYELAYRDGAVPESRGERYIAPIYKLALKDGAVVAPKLGPRDVHVLGTPGEVKIFDPSVAPPFGGG